MVWKKSMLAVVVVIAFLAAPVSAYHDEYNDYEESHPLRIAAYPVHAVGFVLEWLITRPIHALVSQPDLEPIFGHTPDEFSFTEQSRTNVPPSLMSSSQAAPPAAAPPAAPPPAAVSGAGVDAAQRAAEAAEAAAEAARRAATAAEQAAEKADRAFERSLVK